MDLSTGFSVNSLTCSHTEAMDLVKKPEWYRRHTPTYSSDPTSPLRTRCPKMEEAVRYDECRNTVLPPPGLSLYQDSVRGHLWQAGFYHQPSLADATAGTASSTTGTDSDSGSDVIFLLAASKDSAACSSTSPESGGPTAALSSASSESLCSSESSDSSSVIPVRHTRPVVLLSDVKISYRKFAESPINISSDDDDDSAVMEVSLNCDKRQRRVPDDSAFDKEIASDKMSIRRERGDLRRSPRIKMTAAPTVAEFTCKSSPHNLRNQVKCSYQDVDDSEEVMDYIEGTSPSSSSEEEERPNLQRKKQNTSCSSDESFVNSSDDSDDCPNGWQPAKSSHCEPTRAERARCKATPPILEDTKTVPRRNTRLKSSKRLPARPRLAPKKAAPTKPVAGKRRQRQRKRQRPSGPPPTFPPGEPELLLKYMRLRGERKRSRQVDFRPFVHVARSSCTVVNYQEEHNRAANAAAPPPPQDGSLPTSSCYRLGRPDPRGRGPADLQTCCLCGRSANAMTLGDLHGPYYPLPQFPQVGALQGSTEEEEPPSTPATHHSKHRPRAEMETQEVTRGDDSRVHGSGEEEEDAAGHVTDDRWSVTEGDAPRVPALESQALPDERWIHEDCSVWSTGIFLVRGRLYGLKEAANVAKDVVSTGPAHTALAPPTSLRGGAYNHLVFTCVCVCLFFRLAVAAVNLVLLWDVSRRAAC